MSVEKLRKAINYNVCAKIYFYFISAFSCLRKICNINNGADSQLYQIEVFNHPLTSTNTTWTSVAQPPFPGAGNTTTWFTHNAPPTTNQLRFFRVGVQIP